MRLSDSEHFSRELEFSSQNLQLPGSPAPRDPIPSLLAPMGTHTYTYKYKIVLQIKRTK